MLALVIEKTRSFDRQIAVRNALEYIGAVFVVCMFGWFAVKAPNQIVRAGMTIVALSGIWIIYYIRRYGGGPKRPDAGTDLFVYNRLLHENYEQQIRLLRQVKYWYLLPPYVGIVIASIGAWFQPPAGLLGLVVVSLIFGVVWVLNERYGVRHLERLKKELLTLDEGEIH